MRTALLPAVLALGLAAWPLGAGAQGVILLRG
jgi:hypothetical protein